MLLREMQLEDEAAVTGETGPQACAAASPTAVQSRAVQVRMAGTVEAVTAGSSQTARRFFRYARGDSSVHDLKALVKLVGF